MYIECVLTLSLFPPSYASDLSWHIYWQHSLTLNYFFPWVQLSTLFLPLPFLSLHPSFSLRGSFLCLSFIFLCILLLCPTVGSLHILIYPSLSRCTYLVSCTGFQANIGGSYPIFQLDQMEQYKEPYVTWQKLKASQDVWLHQWGKDGVYRIQEFVGMSQLSTLSNISQSCCIISSSKCVLPFS